MKTQANRPFYHVRHDLQPHLAEELLILLWDKSPCHIDILQEVAAERGYRLANRSSDQLLASLGNLRIIGHREHGEIYLSDFGRLIARAAKYNPYLVPELIHFTYYTLYDESTQSNRFSWAYRLVCDYLWSSGTALINSHRLVTLVQEQAQQTFHDYKDYGISFSQNSVTGIVSWLEALDSPCVEQTSSSGRSFARRPFCSSELLLLALEYIKTTLAHGMRNELHLSDEVALDRPHGICVTVMKKYFHTTCKQVRMEERKGCEQTVDLCPRDRLRGRGHRIEIVSWFVTSSFC